MKKAIYLLLSIVLLGSCAVHKHDNKEQVLNKRKYRKGYHFQGFKKSYKKRPDAETSPKQKFKAPDQFANESQEKVEFQFNYRTPISDFEYLENEKIVEIQDISQPIKQPINLVSNTPVKTTELESISETLPKQDKLITPLKEEKQIVEIEEKLEIPLPAGKYEGALGLNSNGVSLLSKFGLNPKGDFPWLAFVIPSFILLSGSMFFFIGRKKRKKESAISKAEKDALILRATIFGIVATIIGFLLK